MLRTIISGLVNGGVFGILALGIVMVYKGSRVLNFAQVELGTFGLFIAWWAVEEQRLPWAVGAFMAIAVVVAISFAFERLVVSRMTDSPRLSVAVATVGLLLLLLAVESKAWGSSPKFLRGPVAGTGIEIAGLHVSWTQIVAVAVAAVVGLGLTAFLRRTDFGLGVLGAAQDPIAVRMMGVSLARVSSFTWVVAGALGAIAVLLVEPTVGAFAPGAFSVGINALFVPALAAALLGGMTNMPRAFLGGLAVGIIREYVQFEFVDSSVPGLSGAALFVIVIGVLLVCSKELSREAA